MAFIRVKHASGPAHEFDISEAAYKRNKGAYTVVDPKPVARSRAVKLEQVQPASSVGKPAGKE